MHFAADNRHYAYARCAQARPERNRKSMSLGGSEHTFSFYRLTLSLAIELERHLLQTRSQQQAASKQHNNNLGQRNSRPTTTHLKLFGRLVFSLGSCGPWSALSMLRAPWSGVLDHDLTLEPVPPPPGRNARQVSSLSRNVLSCAYFLCLAPAHGNNGGQC